MIVATFRESLKSYLKKNRIKKHEFARAIGITPDTLYKYETEQRTLPKRVKLAIMYETNNAIDFPEVAKISK